ncbi:hypothetical protein BDV98DRAFT_565592 [Pterulicium gracile]|uniref:protein kinase C n=1 Tax=Pterulicium gracile TaxID=1884261 RepID=A0A5C3QQZ2_9AGAR|nr:hypothetical protein BDV98DRAFT_565592 [Pterula gracilis]
MGQELDQKIQDLFSRIQKERKILEASKLMRQATANQEVLKQNEAKIRETERSLSYFENTLQELQARKMQEDNPSRSPTSSPTSGLPSSPRSTFSGVDRDRSLPQIPSSQAGPSGAGKGKQMTALDLIKADTPLTTAKISKMLHQLEFKLQVEMQYKKGIDKMAKLYQADGDKRSRVEAEAKRIESEKKIHLLQASLKRYKNLHVLDDAEGEETDDLDTNGERKENIRAKPLSGTLRVTVKGARELDHMPVPALARVRSASKQGVDTFVSLKVEGTERPSVSHPSRTDRWNEDFEIAVDKANEVEMVLYDKHAGQAHQVPIGMLWIRISDLVEAQRRQRVFMESGQGGWVTAAGAMSGDGSSFGPGSHHHHGAGAADVPLNPSYPGSSGPAGSGFSQAQGDGVDAWFSVEPAGAVALRLDFIKENVRKRPADGQLGGLGRQGAVRKRKGEVHEMNGHKFVQKQFYQLMLCAFCNDFLLNALGYQCEDCRYTCHKKCYEKVVTKCISKSNTGEDDDAEKINHRIPHRFEPLTNMGANWCCHCGYMLPLGRKNARKCSECDVTCHANCAHLVPDFCGMSMETANEILRNLRVIKKTRGGKPPTTGRPSPYSQGGSSFQSQALDSSATIVQGMGGMKLSGSEHLVGEHAGRPHSASIVSMDGRPPDGRPPQYQQYQPSQQTPTSHPAQLPPGARPPPGQQNVRMPVASPAHPSSQEMSQPPYDPHMQTRPPVAQQPLPPKQHQPNLPPAHHGPQKQPQPQATHPGHAQPPHRQSQWQGASTEQQQVAPPQQRPKRKVGLDDFNFLAVLGKGNFGKVMLAEEKKTNGLYAIKVLKKEFIIDNDEVDSTRSEKRVFQTAARERHPFLLGLHSCFQTETRIYFVMEYISGGDLMLHIQRKQFSLRQAKFYACEVLLALEYFHANGIIYRDLKLDNILLTLDGHVRVADYGLCKEEMWYGSTTSTFCGTPEFMAPEILLEQRYGRAVDWWAFGVLTYEMLLGQSPFRGDDEDEIFDAILEDEPLYPITMPRDAVSILQQLLTRDPQRRLGSGKEDADEIKRQPFFKDVSWDDVFNKRIPPPYLPTIKGSADTSNFDEEFTREQPTLTPVHGQLSSRDQAEFAGFSWVANWADI